MNCINCNQEVSGNFCSQCGQRVHVKRITFKEGWFDFWDGRVQLFRSQLDHTLWLDRQEYLVERQNLPTQTDIRTLGLNLWPSIVFANLIRTQPAFPPYHVPVAFTEDAVWTTPVHRKGDL